MHSFLIISVWFFQNIKIKMLSIFSLSVFSVFRNFQKNYSYKIILNTVLQKKNSNISIKLFI